MQLSTFAFDDQVVRVVHRDGEPWFVGRDVGRALQLDNHNQALGTLDDDERGSVLMTPSGPGGPQTMIIISEPGVYRLVFR